MKDVSVTEKMKEAGSQMASDLMSAQIAKALGNVDTFHEGGNLDLIDQYLNNEIDSVTAIFLAMSRAQGE